MKMLEVVTEDQRVAVPQCRKCGLPVVEVRVEVRTDKPNVRGSFWKRIDHGCGAHVQPDRS